MVVLAATLVAALPGAAVPARAAAVVAAAVETTVTPGTLQFGGMDPGTTEVRTATLTTDAPDDAAFVRAVVSGTGELADHLTTLVEACAVAWTAQGCSAGGVVLRRRTGRRRAWTRRSTCPCRRAGSRTCASRSPWTTRRPPTRRARSRTSCTSWRPTPPSPPTRRPGTGAGPRRRARARCHDGAEVAALGAAALALVALGLTLRTWVRERRRAGSAGWTP